VSRTDFGATPPGAGHGDLDPDPLSARAVVGIGSLIRDLSLLTAELGRLRDAIRAGRTPLPGDLFSGIDVVPDPARDARVGDVVLFEHTTEGGYPDIETLEGRRVPLEVGGLYVGVLCARVSTKLLSGEVPPGTRWRGGRSMQLIAQAGGVGRATGFSPVMVRESGSGVAPGVRVVGTLRDRASGELLNTIDRAERSPLLAPAAAWPPTVVVVGTATTVGKTTVCAHLIRHLRASGSCGAIKGAGTGWYEEVQLLADAGADPVLDFPVAGLPTTHGVGAHTYLAAIDRLLAEMLAPATAPEALITELGGDLIAGNVPTFLSERRLMEKVRAVLVCAESAVGLVGAIRGLEPRHLPLFAVLPYDANPEGFYVRVEPLLRDGTLRGIVDFAKPEVAALRDPGREYCRHHDAILSEGNLVARILGGSG